MAIFSGLLWWVTDQQRELLAKANDTAHAALMFESGRIMFGEANWGKMDRISYSFKNIGRSAVVIDSIGIRFRPSNEGAVNPIGRYIPKQTLHGVPVDVGGVFSTGERNAEFVPKYFFYREEPVKGEFKGDTVMQFSVFYTTMGRRMHYWCNVWLHDTGILKLNSNGYEREEEAPKEWPQSITDTEAEIEKSIVDYATGLGYKIIDGTEWHEDDLKESPVPAFVGPAIKPSVN